MIETEGKVAAVPRMLGPRPAGARRDAHPEGGNQHAAALSKQPGKHVPEDAIETLRNEVQELLKKYEHDTDDAVAKKTKEIEEV